MVCYYYQGRAQEDRISAKFIDKEQFRGEDGKVDGIALLRHLREKVEDSPEVKVSGGPDGISVRLVHVAIMRFVQRRIAEAQVLEAFHLTPGNVPWDKIAPWRWYLWNQYWSGVSDERDAMMQRGRH